MDRRINSATYPDTISPTRKHRNFGAPPNIACHTHDMKRNVDI